MNNSQIALCALVVLLIGGGLMVGCPTYNVYTSKMDGEAKLAHAQASKEVAVAEAKAKMESASLLAQADTIRAHGVARSNEIIGASLNNNQAYLYWLWIDGLQHNDGNIIYVPTQGNMPVMEAGRFGQIQSKKDSIKGEKNN